MRVHPNILGPKRRTLYGVVALLGLNFLILALGFTRNGLDLGGVEDRFSRKEPTVKVLVLDEGLQTGDSFDTAKVTIRARPVSMLPAARINSRDEIRGKVAAGPLPAGAILSSYFLAEALPQLPVNARAFSDGQKQSVDEFLTQLANVTSAIDVKIQGTIPDRGSRVALSVAGVGEGVLVSEAWVESVRDGNIGRLRMAPDRAVEVAARGTQSFIAIELPQTGVNPLAKEQETRSQTDQKVF